MTSRTLGLVPVIILAVGLLGRTETTPPLARATQEEDAPTHDLEVHLQHVTGQVDTFDRQIVRLELILAPSGRLDQVHLVTRTGSEADTHIWYNVDNLVSVRYRFVQITGKGKVTVRALQPPELQAPTDATRPLIRPLDPEDYR